MQEAVSPPTDAGVSTGLFAQACARALHVGETAEREGLLIAYEDAQAVTWVQPT